MKTGLYKDSFLEDPWKGLIYSQKQPTPTDEVPVGDDEEGDILLSDDDDDDEEEDVEVGERLGVRTESVVGLGDGLVEAVREVA